MSECPDLETLATVIEGTASDETRESVLEHLGECKTCYQTFAGTTRTYLDQEARAWRKKVKRVAPRIAAAVATLAIGVAAAWNLVIGPRLDERPIEPLVEAVQGRRVLEARLAGGFSDADHTGERGLAGETRWRVANAAYKIDQLARNNPSPGRLDALGLAHLLSGDHEMASLLIQEALDQKPDDPVLLTDLAATQYSRYQDGVPEALIEALAAADSAVRDGLPEAYFNRALALSAFHLKGEARLAWREYAAIEPRTEWIREARERESALTPAPKKPDVERLAGLNRREFAEEVSEHPQAVRIHVQETLLPRWGQAWIEGAPSAEHLGFAGRLSDALLTRTSDPLLPATVRAIRDASPDQKERLARAHVLFGAARKAFENLSPGQARPLFTKAEREFETAQSPYALWARFWRQGCAYYEGEPHPEVLAELDRLKVEAQEREYTLLLARVSWLEGLIHLVDLEIEESLRAYTRALHLFKRTGEEGHAAFLHFLVSEDYFVLGDQHHGWRHRIEALEMASRTDAGNKYPALLVGTGFAAFMQGHQNAALYFFEEAARVAEDDVARTEAAIWRARTLAALGEDDLAETALKIARSGLAGLANTPVRDRLAAEALIVEGVLEQDPRLALGHLDEALRSFETRGPDFRLPLLHVARARELLEMGDPEGALADLEAGLDRFRHARESGVFYLSVLDGKEELVEMLVELQARESASRAYATAEAERAHGLSPPTLSRIQDELPPSTAMLYYSVHDEALLVWTLTREEARLTRRSVAEGEIERLTRRFVRSFNLDSDLTTDTGLELSEILLGDLPVVSTVVVIPDSPLEGIPFAALPNPQTGHYLAEDTVIQFAPSASHYLRAKRKTAHRTAIADSLVVGSPRPDPRLFPGLPGLPKATEEAKRIASLYPSTDLLLESAATRETFLKKAPRRDVIHFVGPATTRAQPMNGLLLSPQTNGSSVLLAREVSSLNLSDVQLVVLSGAQYGGLAQAFLEAGVPSVITSLWPLEDPSLVAAFHRHFLNGLAPARALRAAQLEGLKSTKSRASWAGLQLIGS